MALEVVTDGKNNKTGPYMMQRLGTVTRRPERESLDTSRRFHLVFYIDLDWRNSVCLVASMCE